MHRMASSPTASASILSIISVLFHVVSGQVIELAGESPPTRR